MTLTIIVPTIGRPTLVDTLRSIARQALQPDDQVLIVFDSFACDRAHLDATRALVQSFGFTFVAHDGGYHFMGNQQLNHGIALATGDYICALGDDDVYVDGALAQLRKACRDRVVLFQFYAPPDLVPGNPRRYVLWADRVLRVANISGCCMAAPRAALVPVKAERRIEVDFDWIVETVAHTGKPPVWLRACLIIARPDVRNGQTVHRGVGTCKGCGWVGFLEDLSAHLLCAECVTVIAPELVT